MRKYAGAGALPSPPFASFLPSRRHLYARLLFLKGLSRGVMGCDALRQCQNTSHMCVFITL